MLKNGMMLMFNNKTGEMVIMNPNNDTIAKKTGLIMKNDPSTGITMIIDKTGMILDPQTDTMLSSQAGKMAMQNESGMMMPGGMTTNNMMK